MLLLLLLISSGCDVNIPGCGKRSLPFFKKITPPAPVSQPIQALIPTPVSTVAPLASPALPAMEKETDKRKTLDSSVEMSISKPKLVVTSTPTDTSTPMEVEKIAYTTLEKDKPTLWTMNTDGTNRVRLTAVGTGSWYPLWSPNGKVLAFLSDMNPEKQLNLYTVKKGTNEFIQITAYPDMVLDNPPGLKAPFTWSPRSDEIAYSYHNQVWKVDLSTLGQVTLTNLDSAYSISALEWAPHRDTKFIGYLAKKGVNYFGLVLINPRLMDQLKLVDSPQLLSDITWTPDARKIAYIVNKTSIYSASAETSLPKLLIFGGSSELGPLLSYSPAESAVPPLMTLAKKLPVDEGYRVAILDKPASDKDTGSLKYLTEPGVEDAVWSPDGSKIAYVKNGELWTMDGASGAHKTRLAATGIIGPNWSKK